MSKVIVLGGGFCGLASGADAGEGRPRGDGARARPVAGARESPSGRGRPGSASGVAQFRQAHYMQPRGRQVLGAELPDVLDALVAAGAAELAVGAHAAAHDRGPLAAAGRRAADDA